MATPDQDLLTASAAVAAAFEWQKVEAPESVRRRSRVVLQAVSTGAMIAAGRDLAESVARFPWLQLDTCYRPALEATDEFSNQLRAAVRPSPVRELDEAEDPTFPLARAGH